MLVGVTAGQLSIRWASDGEIRAKVLRRRGTSARPMRTDPSSHGLPQPQRSHTLAHHVHWTISAGAAVHRRTTGRPM